LGGGGWGGGSPPPPTPTTTHCLNNYLINVRIGLKIELELLAFSE
jgi:hypothetical protein